jgi:hypothetical protein
MAVIPGHELGCGDAACEIFPRDVESPVGLGTDGIDDHVVMLVQVVARDIGAKVDVTEEAKPRIGRRALIYLGDGFDLLMVRSYAMADEAERGREAVKHIYPDVYQVLCEEATYSVETRGSRADDSDIQRSCFVAEK